MQLQLINQCAKFTLSWAGVATQMSTKYSEKLKQIFKMHFKRTDMTRKHVSKI